MKVRLLRDRNDIAPLLQADSIYAAYAIGDLSAGFFEQCCWAVAEDGGGLCALAMTFAGLYPPALFLMGQSAGLQAILGRALRPRQAYLTMRPEHSRAIGHIYRLAEQRHMWRMHVSAATFRPRPSAAIQLHGPDLRRLNALYTWGGADFFSAYQLEQGVYFAIERDGKLVSAAGTHLAAPSYGVAAVGNVYTHPDYRNQGLATACTSAVSAELLRLGCSSVVLNVRQDNVPAIVAYEKLGYAIHCEFIESPVQRRNALQQLASRISRR